MPGPQRPDLSSFPTLSVWPVRLALAAPVLPVLELVAEPVPPPPALVSAEPLDDPPLVMPPRVRRLARQLSKSWSKADCRSRQ